MAQLLAGKVAIITGGATGIGRAIAMAYLAYGVKVAVNYYHDVNSREVYNETQREAGPLAENLAGIPGDISKYETAQDLITRTRENFGWRIDIFVSNAGVCEFADFLTTAPELVDGTISINLTGAFLAVQAVAKYMSQQRPPGGSIIGISSISALVGGAQQAHYTPTKAGVLSLMQSAACAVGKYRIRCNALLPGTIRTQLNEEDLKDDQKREYMESCIPPGRLGEPRDMVGPAIFLASDLSNYVTGAQLLVDGGLFVNLQ